MDPSSRCCEDVDGAHHKVLRYMANKSLIISSEMCLTFIQLGLDSVRDIWHQWQVDNSNRPLIEVNCDLDLTLNRLVVVHYLLGDFILDMT